MRYFITGGTGFIGSWLVARLLRREAETGVLVRCLVRPKSDRRWRSGLPVEICEGSLADPAALVRGVTGVDCVVHLAGAIRALKPAGFFSSNVAGTKNLLDAVNTANPRLKSLVLISSLAAAGPAPSPQQLTEDVPAAPNSSYGRSKLAAEELAGSYTARLPLTILRPAVVYGPRDQGLLNLFRTAARGFQFQISGVNNLLSIIHVDDLVSAILLAAGQPACAGKTFFVCNPEPVYLSDLAALIAQQAQRSLRKIPIPYRIAWAGAALAEALAQLSGTPTILNRDKLSEAVQPYWVASGRRFTQHTGFAAGINLAQGVAATLEWYQQEGWIPKG